MQTYGANGHQHEVSEKRPALDIELCACGAKRWVDQDGAPATPLIGVCKNGIVATDRPRRPWIPACAGMTEWAR